MSVGAERRGCAHGQGFSLPWPRRLADNTELVDVKNNRWGGRDNRKLANVFTLQGEIAQQISERLRLKLSGEEKERRPGPVPKMREPTSLTCKGATTRGKIPNEADA